MEYLQKSDSFEVFLDRLNEVLAPHFPAIPANPPRHDSCQIVGLPRSGTTVLFQLLARTGSVGYPSNVMAPYWRVPVVGARLQRQLTLGQPTVSLRSVAGRTSEPLDPHEFGYFWRNALGHSGNTLRPDGEGWSWERLQSALDAMCEAFDAPTVHKNFLALHHAPEMRRHLHRSKFLVLARDPRDVAASLWMVRREIHVPDEETFGTDPGWRGTTDLLDRIIEQVEALEQARRELVEHDCGDTLVVDYRELCRSPRDVIHQVLEFIGADPSDEALRRVPPTLSEGQGRAAAPTPVVDKINHSLVGGSS